MQTKNKITKKLQNKLVMFNLVLIILIMIVNIAMFFVYNNMYYKEYITMMQYNTVAQIGNSYETIIDYVQNTIIKTAYQKREFYDIIYDYDGRYVDNMTAVGELEELLAQEGFICSAHLYLKENGTVISSNNSKNEITQGALLINMYGEEDFARITENSSYISTPRNIRIGVDEVTAMTMAVEIEAESGRKGILIVDIDIDRLSRQIINKNTLMGSNIAIEIRDDDGRAFYEYKKDDSGKNAVTAEYYSQHLGWRFVYNQNSGVVYSKFRITFMWFMLFSVAVMLISVLISVTVIRKSTHPVGKMLKNYCDDFWLALLSNDASADGEVLEEMYRQGFDLSDDGYVVAVCEGMLKLIEGNSDVKVLSAGSNEKVLIIKQNSGILPAELVGEGVYIGISSVKDDVIYLHNAYLEAKSCLNYKLTTKQNTIMYEDIKNFSNEYVYDYKTEKKILGSISIGDSKAALAYVEEFFDSITDTKLDDSRTMNAVYQLQNAVLKQISIMPVTVGFEIATELGDTLEDIISVIQAMIKSVCDAVREEVAQKDKNAIYDAVMQMIDDNFTSDDFSVDSIADKLRISKNEISKIVKLKTGLSFPEYMNRMKIEYAKELLLNSNETVENIAKKSGFSYSYYFIKVFREIEGITPKQYRMHKKA